MPLFEDALNSCSDDLRKAARRRELPLVVGREREARELGELLAARRSVLLVGEAGVGKTAVLHRLVSDLERERASSAVPPLQIYQTSTSRLISETKYLGEWQSKLSSVVRDLERIPFSVLYLADVWNLTSVGRSESTDETMADMLKEFVSSRRVVLVGEVTKAQIAAFFDRAPSIKQLFVELNVEPIDASSVRPIIEQVAAHIGARRGVEIDDAALDRAVELTDRFLSYRHQPGKAIELVERAAHAPAPGGAITSASIEEAFAAQTGLPLFVISERERKGVAEIRAFFRERVLGQEHAIDRIVETIALYKAGLNDPTRPIGTFLFVGPTGVGKTELAKALAEFLYGSEARMLRFDMSEYKDYHSFEKLIGDPKKGKPGGSLVEAMRANAFAVVLLDEFEKAHPNIADLFLQVFDDGRLTDASGQTVDFRNAIIILTSNVGTDPRHHKRPIHGFGDAADEEAESRIRRALDEAFRPEFLNRIEHLVVFRPLSREVVRRIALIELARIYDRRGIANRRIAVEVDDRLLDAALDGGFNPRFGARALKREITRTIVVPLAVALMEQSIEPGQIVRLEPRGAGGAAVRVLDTDESRRGREVDEEVAIEGRRLTLAEIEREARELSSRLDALAARYGRDDAVARLAAMRDAQQSPDFWNDQAEALASFDVYTRLAGEVERLRDLGERLATIERRASEALRRKDGAAREELARDFLRVELALARLETELTVFDEEDDRAALVVVRVQGAAPHDISWLDRLADLYLEWANAVRRPVELLYDRARDDRALEPIALLRVDGPYAYGYLKGEAGAHRFRDEERTASGRHAVSAIATVEVAAIGERAPAPDVEYTSAEAIKCEGRRLKRLRSRVVARAGERELWLQNSRNLEENRALAVELLAGALPHAAASGEIVRLYQLAGRRKVRDPRTELAVTGRDVDAYLGGQIDAFLRRNAVAIAEREGKGG